MAGFKITIQTVPGALFATAPAIPGGPIQFIAEVPGAPNQQWVFAPDGLTTIESVGFPGPGFADVVGPGVVDELVNVGPAPRNWFIAPAAGGVTIELADAVPPGLFWGLNDIDQAILAPPVPVPAPVPGPVVVPAVFIIAPVLV